MPAPIDQDKPCEHKNFEAVVEVNRIAPEGGSLEGLMADVKVWCSDCDEKFWWTGCPPGLSFTSPTVSIDGTQLHAPLRPASTDPDFGLGLPSFSVHFKE